MSMFSTQPTVLNSTCLIATYSPGDYHPHVQFGTLLRWLDEHNAEVLLNNIPTVLPGWELWKDSATFLEENDNWY